MTKHKFAIATLLFAALETTLVLFVDEPLSQYMRALDNAHPEIIDIFRAYTDYAKSKWYLWPSGIGVILCALLLRFGRPSSPEHLRLAGEALLFIFASVALSGIMTDILKPILGRARPVEFIRDHATGFHPGSFSAAWNSMPSGHATSAMALAFALAFLFPRGGLVFIIVGVLLAISRVMVNAHHLADIIAGGMVGYLTARLIWNTRKNTRIVHMMHGIFPIDRQVADL